MSFACESLKVTTRLMEYYRETSPLLGYYFCKGNLSSVDGMADIAIADGDFPISALFEPYLEKYRGTTLFSVDA